MLKTFTQGKFHPTYLNRFGERKPIPVFDRPAGIRVLDQEFVSGLRFQPPGKFVSGRQAPTPTVGGRKIVLRAVFQPGGKLPPFVQTPRNGAGHPPCPIGFPGPHIVGEQKKEDRPQDAPPGSLFRLFHPFSLWFEAKNGKDFEEKLKKSGRDPKKIGIGLNIPAAIPPAAPG